MLTTWRTQRVGDVILAGLVLASSANVLLLALPKGRQSGQALGGVLMPFGAFLEPHDAIAVRSSEPVWLAAIIGGPLVADLAGPQPPGGLANPDVLDLAHQVLVDGQVLATAVLSRPAKVAAAVIAPDGRVLAGMVAGDVQLAHKVALAAPIGEFKLVVFAFDDAIFMPETGVYTPPAPAEDLLVVFYGAGAYGAGGYGG